uniref:Uncharacterized protein n=1 Tax=Nelumbo nucifera TaxID=4432 RepID=A0A822ZBQ0_NELNU|nr:TPA_asm: hypothetical protein HUJ06_015222 [Nelumbo nucifera]
MDKLAMNIAVEHGKTSKDARDDVLHGLELVEQACGLSCNDSLMGASMLLAELAVEAGLCNGVLNIIHGNNASAFTFQTLSMKFVMIAISRLYHFLVQMWFSMLLDVVPVVTDSGAHLGTKSARAAARGKHAQSYMGTKNHAVIMPDASMVATLSALVSTGFGAAGQREKELVERANALKVNAGTEPGADLGPVISKLAKEHIYKLIQWH